MDASSKLYTRSSPPLLSSTNVTKALRASFSRVSPASRKALCTVLFMDAIYWLSYIQMDSQIMIQHLTDHQFDGISIMLGLYISKVLLSRAQLASSGT